MRNYRENLSGYEVARWRALEHLVKKILKLKNVSKVLDYGCGSGLHVELWKKLFPASVVYGCDISAVALEKLVHKYPGFKNKNSKVVNNHALFDDNVFDVIVSVEVMEHVEKLNDYLIDVFRLLKPGGVFVWTTPCANRFSIEHVFGKLTNQIEVTNEGYQRWQWEEPGHLRRLKSKEIKNISESIGFDKVDFRFRAHFFSFVCTNLFKGRLKRFGEKLMFLDYSLFRRLPNGASMIGFAMKTSEARDNNK